MLIVWDNGQPYSDHEIAFIECDDARTEPLVEWLDVGKQEIAGEERYLPEVIMVSKEYAFRDPKHCMPAWRFVWFEGAVYLRHGRNCKEEWWNDGKCDCYVSKLRALFPKPVEDELKSEDVPY